MKRRDFLRAGALTLFLAASEPALVAGTGGRGLPGFLPRLAEAARPGRTLVTLFLDGGVDSLNFLVPHGDPDYFKVRRKLAIPPPGRTGGALRLDAHYGLHPRLAPLLPLYREGVLAFLSPIGTSDNSRSHFEAKDYLELGGARAQAREGWLSRLLRATPPRDAKNLLRAVSTSGSLRLAMQGPLPIMTLQSVDGLASSLGGATASKDLLELYRQPGTRPGLRRNTEFVFEVLDRLRTLHPERYRSDPRARYPATPLGESLRLVAFLLKSRVPLEVAYCELNGWDTHANQGTGEGVMAGLQDDLARSVAAFWRDLGKLSDRVALVTMTEFGRRVQENGSGGTDHGHGSVGMVLGGGVKGGRILGRWPGLREDRLFEGIDLPLALDFRDVFLEAAAWMGCRDTRQLFPGFAGGPRPGLLT